MKRFLKAGFVALAVVGAVTTAFTTEMENAPKANEETYTWNRTGGETPPEEQNPFVGTKTQAQNYFGCSGTVDECAVGTPSNLSLPNEVIYQH
ncbi:hypothetical protein [Pedobacter heparinus]|uniref:hypothetical protein n=1 Tax=Pedobacter heparinus TaxID=984 RepID=UPI00292D4FCD|nr:hypothetical protein [Pedobacter heparinus]